MLTTTELGVGDFVLIKNHQNRKFIIIGKQDENVFEVMEIRTGLSKKILKTECLRVKTDTYSKQKD